MKTIYYLFLLFTFGFTTLTDAKAKPIINTTDTVFCNGAPIVFTANASGSVSYIWDFGDNSAKKNSSINTYTYTYNIAGTYIITLVVQDASFNYDTTKKVIRIKPNVTANFNLDQYSNSGKFCISTEFSISQWSDIKGFDSLHWDFGDGTKSKIFSPHHTYTAAGIYNIKLDAYGFCGAHSTSKQVEIVNDANGKPENNLYVQAPFVCPGNAVNISSYFSPPAPDSMRIFTGDGNSSLVNEFDYFYQNKGIYLLKSIAYNRCGSDTDEFQLTVTDSFDHQSYLYKSSATLCQGQTANLSVSGIGINKTTIDMGDGNVKTLEKGESYLNHVYSTTGTFNVQAILEYECGQPDTLNEQFIVGTSGTVYPFSIYLNQTKVCPNEQVYINGPYIEISDTLFVDYGDGTTETIADRANSITHRYGSTGTYTIIMKKINACGNFESASTTLNVSSNTTNVLQIVSNYSGQEKMRCISDTIAFGLNNGSEITNGRFWFSDGSSFNGLEVKRPFANVGTYQVLASAVDLCGNTLEAAYSIDINNSIVPPSVNYWFQPLAQCVNQGFIFDNLTDNATKMVWDFGDGTIEEQPLFLPHVFHAYNKAGYYNVVLTASNGCGSTLGKSRSTVIAAPTIQFDVSKSSIYKGDTVYFNNRTKGYSDFTWYFNYDENDTSTHSNPYKVYNQAGTFPVSMIAFNEFGCWDTVTKYINVSTMGIQDKNGINQMTIYPNPANNKLFIEMNQAFVDESLTIQIVDLNGRILINQKFENPKETKQVDINQLPNGTYLLRVNNGKEIMHGKFIVIH